MARVIFQVGEEEKALWVEAAHRELVSLSEWLRRAAMVRAGGLAAGASHEKGREPISVSGHSSVGRGAPAVRPSHNADPKDGLEMARGPRERSNSDGLCEHRVPLGSFCKRCEENGLSAGEQPGGASRAVPVGEVEPGDRGALGVPSAPAERPFQPDWKKGKR